MALNNVQGKTAIVTGAGAGINLCFAKLLLSKGCNVVFADLQLRPESKEVIDAHQNGSPKAIFQETNVTDWMQLERMFKVCEDHFGSADIVCPGAGVFEPPFSNFWIPPGIGSSKDTPNGNSYLSLDINITHPIRTTQLAISHFIKHDKPGSVVHISSIAAQGSSIMVPLYNASKAAISSFVRSLANLEQPQNNTMHPIRVTAVAPGVVKTPLWTDNPDKLYWKSDSKDQWIAPEEVAERMLELITKDEYVGGTVLQVGALGNTRKVTIFNDPGPSGPGTFTSNHNIHEVWDKLDKGWGSMHPK